MNVRTLRILTLLAVTSFLGLHAFGQGETCETAVPVTPGTYMGDGPATGGGINNTCFGFGGFNGDWYSYTPAANGTWTVGACNGGTDTRLSVFTGVCGSLVCLGFSDDYCQMYPGGNSYASEVPGLPAVAGTTYYIQWDDNWTTAGYNWYLNFFCANAPVASFDVVPDCANGQFSIQVDITALGSATDVTINNTGGAPGINNVGIGTYMVGPFPINTSAQIIVVNNSDAGCDAFSANLTNFPCPIISCGPDTYTHCYGNGETYIQVFQGTTSYPIRMHFNSGNIYPWDGDVLNVYDGLDDQTTPIYTGVGNNGDFSNFDFTSTNPEHALAIKLTSTAFTSCGDGGVSGEWNYTVGCLDCTPASVSDLVVNTDCELQQFTVSLVVTDQGSDSNVEIANNVGVPSTFASQPGTYVAGPFPVGSPVTLTLLNDQNALCNVLLGTFENSFCPIQIVCGEPAFEDSYCYQNGDFTYWVYENTGSMPLALLFTQGMIESQNYDHLRIYGGVDNTGDLLYEHLEFFTINLADVDVIVTQPGQSIYMEMSSDGSVSCQDGSFPEPWLWTVGCLDCLQPQAVFSVVLDCVNSQFSIHTAISDIGTDPTIVVTNTGGAPSIDVTQAGTYISGPFAFGASVQVSVEADVNSLCSVHSPFMTNAPCPLVDCGPNQYTYCYPNAMDTSIVYQSASVYPIALIFNAGQIATYGDSIYVYDGPDYQSDLIYAGNSNQDGDLAGELFTSTNPQNALLVRFRSDMWFESCQDQFEWTPWDWTVSCLDCTNPELTFDMEPDCVHNGYNIVVDVTNVGDNAPQNLAISNSYNTDTIFNVGVGTTVVGPFPVDELTHLTVMNAANPLCRRVSQDYTYPSDSCIQFSCIPQGYEYCYQNADTAFFIYASGSGDPVTINFGWGQLLVNDYIQIYNGLDTTAQLVYMGNNGGQVGGFSLSSSNPDNALTLLIISSQSGACANGQATSMYWTVGCGLVGVNEYHFDGFALFPNPTNGELHVRLDEAITGNVRMEVLDVMGRLVSSEQFSAVAGTTRSFDLSDLVAGNYAVRLSTATWSKTQQLQVAR